MNAIELVRSCFTDMSAYNPDAVFSLDFNGSAITHVGVFYRQIRYMDAPIAIVGIGYVCTDPGYRGLGLMRATMNLVHRQVAKFPFALLWGPPRLYEPHGYVHWANLPDDHYWMAADLSGRWDERANVDLLGQTW